MNNLPKITVLRSGVRPPVELMASRLQVRPGQLRRVVRPSLILSCNYDSLMNIQSCVSLYKFSGAHTVYLQHFEH